MITTQTQPEPAPRGRRVAGTRRTPSIITESMQKYIDSLPRGERTKARNVMSAYRNFGNMEPSEAIARYKQRKSDDARTPLNNAGDFEDEVHRRFSPKPRVESTHMYARALGPCMPSVTGGIRPYAPCHMDLIWHSSCSQGRGPSTPMPVCYSPRGQRGGGGRRLRARPGIRFVPAGPSGLFEMRSSATSRAAPARGTPAEGGSR